MNRLTKIESTTGGRPVSSHTYGLNQANQRTKRTDADGSYWDYGYDSLGQVTNAVRKWADGTPVAGQQYGYLFDDIGNRQKSEVSGQWSDYAANLLNQYSQRTVPGFIGILGSAASNATVTVNDTTAGRQGEYFRHELALANTNAAAYSSVAIIASMLSGTNNVAVTNTGSAFLPKTPETFQHDADGNLTSDGRWLYQWDAENRLVAMETSASVTSVLSVVRTRLEFAYDHQSRRIQKQVYAWESSVFSLQSSVSFVYDGWNLLGELNGSNAVLRTYAWGLDLSGTEQGAGGIGGLLWMTSHLPLAASHFASFDGNGNVAALLNSATGQVSAEYEYSPFGETIRATGPAASENPFNFSTKCKDAENGLLYYGYRYYQPSIGRWTSRDPYAESGGLNLNGFVKNDLVNHSDYLGLGWWGCKVGNVRKPELEFRIVPAGQEPGFANAWNHLHAAVASHERFTTILGYLETGALSARGWASAMETISEYWMQNSIDQGSVRELMEQVRAGLDTGSELGFKLYLKTHYEECECGFFRNSWKKREWPWQLFSSQNDDDRRFREGRFARVADAVDYLPTAQLDMSRLFYRTMERQFRTVEE